MDQARKVILCDVDETLIDTTYSLTVDQRTLRDTIRTAQRHGISVGLNSDSGLGTLQRLAREWNMKGPIVAERGALISLKDSSGFGVTKFLLGKFNDEFLILRNRFLHALMENQGANKYVVVLGDVNNLANSFPSLSGTEPQVLILVNGFRERSLGFYVRRRADEGWTKCPEATSDVIGILDNIGPSIGAIWDDRDVDANPDYGICIVHHRGTQKTLSVDQLLGGNSDQIFMIGNSMSDNLNHPSVIQCAVGNAHPKYKEVCQKTGGLIACHNLTAGVIELIDRILYL